MHGRGRHQLLGIDISSAPLTALTENVGSAFATRSPFVVACANPHSLVVAQSDPGFRKALAACDVVVSDGVGVSIACRLAGTGAVPRITGDDIFKTVMAALDRRGGRAFFFGSNAHVLGRIASRVNHDYPRIGVETLAPPYGDWSAAENAAMVEQIREGRPDVLWVGMTAPRQEKWVYANAAELGIPVIGSIGAVFDYYAETVRRAPAWYRKCGLEWLYRLLHEPRRLWRRTLVSAPQFLWMVFRERVIHSS
jgi:N-acetylglucosaminyldiphosphoundecaprenol N-acetyl-beta-D-mannosaminyltransferase